MAKMEGVALLGAEPSGTRSWWSAVEVCGLLCLCRFFSLSLPDVAEGGFRAFPPPLEWAGGAAAVWPPAVASTTGASSSLSTRAAIFCCDAFAGWSRSWTVGGRSGLLTGVASALALGELFRGCECLLFVGCRGCGVVCEFGTSKLEFTGVSLERGT